MTLLTKRWLRVRHSLQVVASVCALAGVLTAQSSVRAWGAHFFDTRALELPCIKLASCIHRTAILRADGLIFQQGQCGSSPDWGDQFVPPPPPGSSYVDVAIGAAYGLGMLNNGVVVGWGTALWPPGQIGVVDLPVLPPGMHYTQMAAGDYHALLARSDGALLGWCASGTSNHGQGNVPALAPGLTVTHMEAKGNNSAFLLSDGSLLVWGENTDGQCNVPSLPPGVTYTAVSLGGKHTVALRSDGDIEAFGNNFYGECNVPALPAGLRYTQCVAGLWHSAACRSDGQFVAWGDNQFLQCVAPQVSHGVRCTQLVAGNYHTVARMSDGTIVSWGFQGSFESGLPSLPGLPLGQSRERYVDAFVGAHVSVFLQSDGTIRAFGLDNYGQADVPALPSGIKYTAARTYWVHSAAIRSDGQLVAWGDNADGECTVPPLPSGTRYVRMALGDLHTVALRSDGDAVAFGWNIYGQCNIPQLPTGTSYIDVDAGDYTTLLLRSDGVIVQGGLITGTPPPLPPGVVVVDIAGFRFAATLRSDGLVDLWGTLSGGGYWVPPPPLPFGVYYVEVEVGRQPVVLRRSDGEVVVCGSVGPPYYDYMARVPALEPGTSYVQVSASEQCIGARVGPTSTYISFAPGCAGSRPATRLVPRDTPRIGKPLQVTLFDLPVGIAMVAMSFQQLPAPLDLTFLSMPGCQWHVPLDAIGLLSGQNNQAKFILPIPDIASLVGLHFFHQALVLDPSASSSLGAVVSDAAEGVVGNW